MGYWLAKSADAQSKGYLKRFDPRYWTVNFPRPMMAGVTTTGPHSLRVDATFYKTDDLAGLIWDVEDRFDHPLLAYEIVRDFRGLKLDFDWQSSGILALDAVNGPTLTIEGRTQNGSPKSWYVRLWNYASGTPANAHISLDFDALEGGFSLPENADPIWAGDIDRMFISLVAPGFTTVGTPLAIPIEAWLELSNILCDGPRSTIEIGNVVVPPHGLSMATGYDDSYNLTPQRVLENIIHLGYRGSINHYVGMSHYFRLSASGTDFYVSSAGGALNKACAKWHADFAVRAKAMGYSVIMSLSYELFDAHCWNDWKQRAWNGDPALTGWVPPSTLLSPVHGGAMAYLKSVARAFVQLAVDAGHAPRFQIGEPWWWVMSDGRICLYDNAAKLALGGNPLNIPTVRSAALTAAQKSLLDAAGVLLASSTAALAAAVKLDHPTCETILLIYLPTILDEAAPDVQRANVPLGWAAPAYNILQLEDYDWVTSGNSGATERGVAAATLRLGYSVSDQHYLSGFILNESESGQWQLIERAAQIARKRGVSETFVWALPQVLRDGFTAFEEGETSVDAFDDVLFPLALGNDAQVIPTFSTAIVTTASGREQRNANWASGRMRYDAAVGVRSEADVKTIIAFFRARRGAAKAFRFRDPLDHSSNAVTGAPTAMDQIIGTADGIQTRFALIKRYGVGADAERRSITRPVAGSLLVAVGGVPRPTGWSLSGGDIIFTAPPAAGQVVTAGFLFDVPVRFAEDSLEIDATTFATGQIASIPLVEIREG